MNSVESFKTIQEKMPKFKEDLYESFNKIFPKGWRYGEEDSIDGVRYWTISGTAGYFEALESALLKNNLKEVLDFYNDLGWVQSDDWDWELECLLDEIPSFVEETTK